MNQLDQFLPIAEAVTKLLYPLVEVAVHNIEEDRIDAIFNNFSGRRVGDSSMIDHAKVFAEGPDVHGPFEKRLQDGRRAKYVWVLLRNQGRAVGIMCISFDMSVADKVQDAIQMLLGPIQDSSPGDLLFRDDWQDRITTFIHEQLRVRNVSLATLSPTERRELVDTLESAGAFKAKNAAGFAAQVLGVSRATIYNDLAKVREALPTQV